MESLYYIGPRLSGTLSVASLDEVVGQSKCRFPIQAHSGQTADWQMLAESGMAAVGNPSGETGPRDWASLPAASDLIRRLKSRYELC
jgi:hypothetical protein